ncbi:cuticle protein 7-like [Episyrphus balteatus]|uniref:cuticle protein 7-like n=1 Tax=Episyrphus balteatus TaxID=286459 RepID=UPI0024852365|nr:cuticle protein 7-like [Episyrphus balteatus]
MFFKFIIPFALIAVASAGYLSHHQPILAKAVEASDPHPQYQFSYSVNDALTGDVKSQSESRDGDLVQGEYSLNDADGYKRTVQYSSDAIHGFNAIVNRQPLGQILKTAPAPIAYAEPSLVKAAQITYAAAPTLVRSPLAGYTQTYAGAPTLIRSSPIAYAHGPAAYTTQGLVRSAPITYASAPGYATLPAFAYHH